MTTVVISGAGVAGLALAAAFGDDVRVVLVERAHEQRTGGQTVDLRGPAREAARRLGVLDDVRARVVDQRGYALVDDRGRARYRVPVDVFGGHGIVSEVEVLRGDLVEVLARAARGAQVRWGDEVTGIDVGPDGVDVAFRSSPPLRADLVVGADGPRSAVRRLVFGPHERFARPLGLATAWFTAPGDYTLDGWFLAHSSPGGRTAALRPDHTAATTKAGLTMRTDTPVVDGRPPAEVRRAFADRFAGTGWHGPRLAAAALAAPDFAAQDLARIEVPRWSSGRVALLGDAAWCTTPLTGMGTSFAVVGAWWLAHHVRPLLLGGSDPSAALDRWEADLRPWIARRGRLPPGGASAFAPRTRAGIAVGGAVMRALTSRPLRPLAARLFADEDDLTLPAPDDLAARPA